MTLVTGTVESIAGAPDSARWVFASPVLRESSDGDAMVTTKRVTAVPVGGVVSVELDPGPCVVTYKNASYAVTVPDTDMDLWDLIGTAVAVPPSTSDAVLAAAVAAYLESHPIEGGGEGGASLSVSRTATTVTVASDSGTDATVPAADGSNAGVMTSAMQVKLAGISGSNTGDQDLSGYATTASLAAKENIANKGAVSGYAPLDSSQLVPSIYLPSYVDDVLEYANVAAFPGTGTSGKIFVALDSNKTYRWSGSAYVEISSSPGSTDAVTEGATNKYYPAADAAKLAGIATGAEVNVNPDWNAVSGDAQILNKPTLGAGDVTLTGTQTITGKTVGDDLKLAAIAAPAAPATGTIKLYNRTGVSGIDALAYISSIGVPVVLGRDVCFYAKNTTGSTIAKGSAVYVSSASASTLFVSKAQADATMTKLPAVGLAAADILNNAYGMVIQSGLLQNVNTGGMSDGATIYVSGTTAGAFTNTAPTHPAVEQAIGLVVNSNITTGSILVTCCNAINLHRIDGVNGASFAIGDGTGTTKSLLMKNTAGTGTLAWNPSANRTLTLPDATGIPTLGQANSTPTALTLWTGTQAQYDAIGSKSGTTVYVVTA